MNHIPKLLQDKKFVFDFFSKHLTDITSNQNLSIKKINIYSVKENIKSKKFNLINIYNIFLFDKQDPTIKTKKIKIVCSGNNNGSRRKLYKINQYLFSNQIKVPKPLFYEPQLKSFFYKGVNGTNLLQEIEYCEDFDLIKKIIKDIATETTKLHQLPPQKIVHKIKFNKKNIDPSRLLNNSPKQKEFHQIFKQILKQIKKTSKNNLVFSHGDLHLENIVINYKKEVFLIDLAESCLADFTYDIGSFLEQLQNMTLKFLQPNQIEKLEKIFLDEYFKHSDRKLDEQTLKQIKYYKLFFSLKNIIYYHSFPPGERKDNIINGTFERTIKNLKYLSS